MQEQTTENIDLSLLQPSFDPRAKCYILFITLFVVLYSDKYSILALCTVSSLVLFVLVLRETKIKLKTLIITLITIFLFSAISTLFSYFFLHRTNYLRIFILIAGRFCTSFFIVSWFFGSVNAYEISIMLEKMFVPPTLTWMFVTTYQFIPIFVSEARIVNDIRKLRGIKVITKHPVKAYRSLKFILNPLIATAVNRGIDLAEAMVIKGFRPKRRKVRIYDIKWGLKETIIVLTTTTAVIFWLIYSPF